MTPRDQRGPLPFQGLRLGAQRLPRLAVAGHDARATTQAKARRGHAARPEAHDHHALSGQLGLHGHHVGQGSGGPETSPHRNFKLERLMSAKRMEMIQNRTMILGSAHPFFS
jgi:hypothetical protein